MPTQTAVLDREQLRNVTMDDPELMTELISALIDDTARQLVCLHQAVERADGSECARVAHYVKGACANVGAAGMSAILKDIEHHAAEGKFNTCKDVLEQLDREFERLQVESHSL